MTGLQQQIHHSQQKSHHLQHKAKPGTVPSPTTATSTTTSSSSRRDWIIRQVPNGLVGLAGSLAALIGVDSEPSHAAPPISIIAEELGYFPVRSPKTGDVMFIPKRVTRPSSSQAIELARWMKEKDITMYGTYWCPHCARQKELFGAEAWSIVPYVECSPKGYGYGSSPTATKICTTKVDGYPTFRDPKGKIINVSGERPLDVLAREVGFPTGNFDPSLETNLPELVGASACKTR